MALPPQQSSLVEVRFLPVSDTRTQVERNQSSFEALGDMAEMMRRGYGSGWVLIFEGGFREACDAAAG